MKTTSLSSLLVLFALSACVDDDFQEPTPSSSGGNAGSSQDGSGGSTAGSSNTSGQGGAGVSGTSAHGGAGNTSGTSGQGGSSGTSGQGGAGDGGTGGAGSGGSETGGAGAEGGTAGTGGAGSDAGGASGAGAGGAGGAKAGAGGAEGGTSGAGGTEGGSGGTTSAGGAGGNDAGTGGSAGSTAGSSGSSGNGGSTAGNNAGGSGGSSGGSDGGTAGSSGGPACTPPEVLCGGTCVDASNDDANCGACGNTCTGAYQCVNAQCEACGDGTVNGAEACDPAGPALSCPPGTAGTAICTAQCQVDTTGCKPVCLPEGAAEGSVRCVEQNGVGKLESCQSGNWSTPSLCEGNAGCQDASGCKPLAGPTMVREPAKGYWIDSTEVTNAQYKKFLDSKPDIKTLPTSSSSCLGQNPNIGGNHSFYPGVLTKIGTPCVSSSSSCDFTYDDAYMNANPSKPVVCVDWCDASAYCEWAGKRLCGDINGGPLDSTLYKDSSASQWYRACAGPSGLVYPYGNSYEPTTCNTQGTSLLDVGQKANCEGSLPDLHDMSGNVWEWEGACTTYQPLSAYPDKCLQRGGAYETGAPATYGRCDSGDPICYMDQRKYLGFRCCSVK